MIDHRQQKTIEIGAACFGMTATLFAGRKSWLGCVVAP
jgi:hypothetical protein